MGHEDGHDGDGEEEPQGGEGEQSDSESEAESEEAESTDTVGTEQQYAVEDYIPYSPGMQRRRRTDDSLGDWLTGSAVTFTIGDIPVPGIYDVTEKGEGRKSQYLREVQAGSQSSSDTQDYGIRNPEALEGGTEGDTSGESAQVTGGGSGGGEKVPPLALTIKAHVGSATYAELDTLREAPATEQSFDVTIGDVALEDCELVRLERSLSGEQPYAYDCTIEVREVREYEVIDTRTQYGIRNGDRSNTDSTTTPTGKFVTPVSETPPEGENISPRQASMGGVSDVSGGQALRNVHITGGSGTLNASGDGWAIQNVAITGVSSGGGPLIYAEGRGIIENVYIDGQGQPCTGVLSQQEHSSEALIRFAHVRNCHDNGLYLSPAGNGSDHQVPGHGGKWYVEHCYCEDNAIADYRLGTSGSFVRDSVSVNNAHRSMWGYYEETAVVRCDFDSRIVCGGNSHKKQQTAAVNVTDSRFNGKTAKSGPINGSSQGSPNLGMPDRVPASPDEAVNGSFYSDPP